MEMIVKRGLLHFSRNHMGPRVNCFKAQISLKAFSQCSVLLLLFYFSHFLSLTVTGAKVEKNFELKATSISPFTSFLVFRSTIPDEQLTSEARLLTSTQPSHGIASNDARVNVNVLDELNLNPTDKIGSQGRAEKHQSNLKQWNLNQQSNRQEKDHTSNLSSKKLKPEQRVRMESRSKSLKYSRDFQKSSLLTQNRPSTKKGKTDIEFSVRENFNDHGQLQSMAHADDPSRLQKDSDNPRREFSITRNDGGGGGGEKCSPLLLSKEIEWRKRNSVVMAFLPYMEPSTCDPPVKCSVSTTVNRHIYLQEGDSLEVMIEGPENLALSQTLSASVTPSTPQKKEDPETSQENAQIKKDAQSKKIKAKQTGNKQKEDISGELEISANNDGKSSSNYEMKSNKVAKINSTTYLFSREDLHPHLLRHSESLVSSSSLLVSSLSSAPLRGPEKRKKNRKRRNVTDVKNNTIAKSHRWSGLNEKNTGKSAISLQRENVEKYDRTSRNNTLLTTFKLKKYMVPRKKKEKKEKRRRKNRKMKIKVSAFVVKRNVLNDNEENHFAKATRMIATKTSIVTSSLTIWKVTNTEWSSCSTREGGQIAQSSAGGIATIRRESLPVGDNYFIGRSSWSSSECFKLRVKVRTSDCGEGSICSGKGICFANETMEEYECACCRGYNGRHCEERDACIDSPCLNAGFCLDIEEGHDGESFQCLCPYGYRGRLCETPSSLCDSNPCQNGGFCEGNHTSYICRCSSGWTGTQCLEESTVLATEELKGDDVIRIPFVDNTLKKIRDEKSGEGCAHGPCVHGVCVETTSQGYRCFCQPGFGGDRCELEYNECFSNPCPNGGTCIDQIGSFQCLCGPGYRGTNCMTKVNMCMPDPCPPNKICIDKGNSHSCECVQDLSDDCGINEEICDPNPCAHGGTCYPISETLSFYCACRPGFTGQTCHDASILESVGPYGTAKPVGKLNLQHASFSSHPFSHMRKLYTGAVTLACAFIIFLLVVSICHCRGNRPYSQCSIPLVRPSLRFLPSFARGLSGSLRDKKRRDRSTSMRMDRDTDGTSPSMTYSNADNVYYNMDVCDNQELPLIK